MAGDDVVVVMEKRVEMKVVWQDGSYDVAGPRLVGTSDELLSPTFTDR